MSDSGTGDTERYGHEGPIERDSFDKRGETVETWLCRACGCSVPRDEREMLADCDCGHYQSVKEGIESGVTSATDSDPDE